MSHIKQSLTKVLNDLIGNRQRQVEHVQGLQLQMDTQKEALSNFDTVIASVRHQLKDETGAVEAGIKAELESPDLHKPVEIAPPLTAAGAGENAAGAASADGAEGTDGNGSPVA